MRSIKSIQRYLRENGVKSRVYESAPGRGNLTATIRGSVGGATLMFGAGHVDVAPISEQDSWEVDPFSATVKDGYVWGRGSHDMLFMVTAHVQAFIDINRSRHKPKGDILLLVVSDEEEEGVYGTEWMLDKHPDAMRTDYAVSEAGGWLDAQKNVVFTNGEKGDQRASPIESAFVSDMEKAVRSRMPEARLVPEVMPGKTDLRFLRKLGVEAYGFGLYDPETPKEAMTVHGPNERVSLNTLELTYSVITYLGTNFSI